MDNETTEAIQEDVPVAAEDEAQDLPVVRQNDAWMVNVKIDGVESAVPLDTVRAAYQKNRAADARLEHAARLSQQLAAQEQKLREREQALARVPEPDMDSMLGKVADEIYNGNAESVKQAMAPMFKAVSQKMPDIDSLVQKRVEQSLHDQRVADAVSWFQTTHADLATDSDMSTFVLATAKTIMDAQPTASPMVVLQQAVERVQDRLNPSKKKTVSPPTRSARMPVEPPSRDPTLKDIVEQINKSRQGRKV